MSPRLGDNDVMPFLSKLGDNIFADRGLNVYGVRTHSMRPETIWEVFGVHSWFIQGMLDFHAELYVVKEELERPLVLTIATWSPKDHIGFPISSDETRCQGAAWAFTWF